MDGEGAASAVHTVSVFGSVESGGGGKGGGGGVGNAGPVQWCRWLPTKLFFYKRIGQKYHDGRRARSAPCPKKVLRCLWYIPTPPPPLVQSPHVSYFQWLSVSLLKLGWWPSATKDTKANKSSSFQHLPSPKGLPTPHPRHPIPCEDGSLALFLFSASLHSPQLTPPPRLTKHLFSHVQVKKRPSFPLFDKRRLKPRWGLPAKMPGTRQGCPPLPPLALSSRPRVHPSFAFALFFTFSTPLLRGSLTQRALAPFRVANSQPHIKTSSDSAERKRPDLAERDIRHGCQWPFCIPLFPRV